MKIVISRLQSDKMSERAALSPLRCEAFLAPCHAIAQKGKSKRPVAPEIRDLQPQGHQGCLFGPKTLNKDAMNGIPIRCALDLEQQLYATDHREIGGLL